MRVVRAPDIVALVALVAFAGCRARSGAPAQTQASAAGTTIAPAAGTVASVDATVRPPADAALPPADAASDARLAAPAWPVAPGADVPEFGCIGWSRKRGTMACVLGSSFSDSGLDVSLAFVSLRPDAELIAPLELVNQPGRSWPAFPPGQIAPFNNLLRGFSPLDRTVSIEARWADDRGQLVVTPPITAGGATLSLQLVREGTMIVAPKYRATLWIRFAGHPRVMIEDLADAISHLEARVFTVGGAVIIERIYSVGDEGTYGTFIRLWQCTPDNCDDAVAAPTPPTSTPPASTPP